MVVITIDTQKDSREEILKIVDLLTKISGKEMPEVSEGAFNIFNTPPKTEEEPEDNDEEEYKIKPIFY